uniref:Choline/ethanolamine transporter FLVCR1 n=1 Tax=Timema douglasi TaxID=61478 RepID=A0A7R8VB51_TIMDO|nr:unnamed protein product [Timema douglasi]
MSSDYKLVSKTEPSVQEKSGDEKTYQLYAQRWLVLGIFVSVSMLNATQWIQFAIVGNIMTRYYGVGNMAIEWTSMIYMVTYIPLMLPAVLIMDKWGIRKSLILGSFGTAVGSWIKVAGIGQSMFWAAFTGQAVVATSQVFILSVPPRLAAVWFPADKVSSACSIGVFGNQLGIAVGFLLSPLMVKNHPELKDIGSDLAVMYYGMAGITTLCFFLVLLFFREGPPTSPSATQDLKMSSIETPTFGQSLKKLFGNVNYLFLIASYGINVGVFFALSTLLNQIILMYFPGGEEFAGSVGLDIIVSGMVGSVVSGFILDKTHKFKETALAVYCMSLVGMVVFTFTVDMGSKIIVYFTSGLLGFFMTGYLPVGFEFAAELTYPEPETTSAGILSASTQVFGVIFTSAYSWLLGQYGPRWANAVLSCTLVAGAAMTAAIKADLRRQGACAQAPVAANVAIDNKILPVRVVLSRPCEGLAVRSKTTLSVRNRGHVNESEVSIGESEGGEGGREYGMRTPAEDLTQVSSTRSQANLSTLSITFLAIDRSSNYFRLTL